jgi:flagellar hook protein FlgE
VFAASLAGSGSSQIGIGANVAAITQQFTQGNISTTNSPLDLAINGQGFFQMSNSQGVSYTRNGQFQVNKDGYVVNAQGDKLNARLPLPSGGFSFPTVPVLVDTSAVAPQATGGSILKTGVEVGLNLDSRATPPSTAQPAILTGGVTPVVTLAVNATIPNNVLTVTVNGVTQSVTIPDGPVGAGAAAAYASAGDLASAVQTAINAKFPVGYGVKVVASGNVLTMTTQTGGNLSSLQVGGNAAANLFGGATPVAGTNPFSVTSPSSYTSATSATVYDTLGNPHTLGMYFVKTADASQSTWYMYTNLDGGPPAITPTGNPYTQLIFNSQGILTTPSPNTIAETFQLTNGADPMDFKLDLTGSTQYGSIFGVNRVAQDGYTSGSLAGLSVSPDGILQGRYTNGQTRNLAQIVLFKFSNPNGLMSLGGNQWQETSESGQGIANTPNSNGMGSLQSAAIEESNVDLTAQLVNMITAQRAYQANAQTIKTQDALMQTLVNLR